MDAHQRQQNEQAHARDDGYVSHVINCRHHPWRGDEVNDEAVTERNDAFTIFFGQSIGQITECATQKKAENCCPGDGANLASKNNDDNCDDRGQDREHPGCSRGQRERCTGVTHEIELQEITKYWFAHTFGEGRHDPHLAELVSSVDNDSSDAEKRQYSPNGPFNSHR